MKIEILKFSPKNSISYLVLPSQKNESNLNFF